MMRTASPIARLMAGSVLSHDWDEATVRWVRYTSPRPLVTSTISTSNVVPPPIRCLARRPDASPMTIRPRR